MNMSKELLMQVLYALEARLRDLNNRGSEPTNGSIASTHAAIEIVRAMLLGKP